MILAQRCRKVAEAVVQRRVSYSFLLLCDEDRVVIKRYGVWHPIGFAAFNTAHPACFLIDAQSHRLRYAFVGSSQFMRVPMGAILDAAREQELR